VTIALPRPALPCPGLQEWQIQHLTAVGVAQFSPLEKAAALGHTATVRALLAVGSRIDNAHLGLLLFLTEAAGDKNVGINSRVVARQLGEALLAGCQQRAAYPAALAAETWDICLVASAIKGLVAELLGPLPAGHPPPISRPSETAASLASLLSCHRNGWLAGEEHAEQVADLFRV